MILDVILQEKRKEVARKKAFVTPSEMKSRIGDAPQPLDFGKALERSGGIPAVIAEVKKASPSKGVIRQDFEPVSIARAYESAGASAISVLTDEKFFKGSLDYLTAVKKAVSLPVLRKDFLIDDYQVYEARAAGADAVLLIAAALDKDQMSRLLEVGRTLGMQCLVEVHNEQEMRAVLETDAQIIGINNRDLGTFKVSLETTADLVPLVESAVRDGLKVVSESGIFNKDDMIRLGEMDVDAVLIGEALMREPDVGRKLRELVD